MTIVTGKGFRVLQGWGARGGGVISYDLDPPPRRPETVGRLLKVLETAGIEIEKIMREEK